MWAETSGLPGLKLWLRGVPAAVSLRRDGPQDREELMVVSAVMMGRTSEFLSGTMAEPYPYSDHCQECNARCLEM